jgi:hypothetical protein
MYVVQKWKQFRTVEMGRKERERNVCCTKREEKGGMVGEGKRRRCVARCPGKQGSRESFLAVAV